MLTVYVEVNQVFTNVRFGVTGGAHLSLTGIAEIAPITFTGITNLVRSLSRQMLLR